MNAIDRVTKFRLTCDVDTRHFHCGHEYVEIGGVKWATMNIGATSPTESGLYFQWGDTQGYTADQVGNGEGKKAFTFYANYKYWNDTSRVMTKYNATDGKTVLEPSDDAVTAVWGNGWRMPTNEEFMTLGNAVNAVWTTDYQGSGINGLVCVDKTDPSKVLFFPAASYALEGTVGGIGSYGFYWSSSLGSDGVSHAYSLYLDSDGISLGTRGRRSIGCPLRGVLDN